MLKNYISFLLCKNNETLTSIYCTANVSFMNNLQKLNARADCGIDQYGKIVCNQLNACAVLMV